MSTIGHNTVIFVTSTKPTDSASSAQTGPDINQEKTKRTTFPLLSVDLTDQEQTWKTIEHSAGSNSHMGRKL